MKRCSLKRNNRPKAIWGTLIGAGIGAIGNIIGATQQAKAQEEQARMYAEGIRQQNENAVKLQNQMIDVMKNENEKNRQLMATSSLNEAMQMGGENAKSIYNMNRIVLKKGGRIVRRKLRNGNDAIPFRVLRGGGFMPIEVTPDGIFGEFYGRTHKQGGIDVDVNVGDNKKEQIEVEDKEGGFIPFDSSAALDVLSTRTKNGFNTMNEVRTGRMTPEEAFKFQELNKKIDNKMTYRRSLKRTKAATGRQVIYTGPLQNRYTYPNIIPSIQAKGMGWDYDMSDIRKLWQGDGYVASPYSGFDTNKYYDTARRAATINTIGNVGGALLSGIGGLAGSAILARGYRNAATYLPKPDEMKYVDISDALKNYKAPKAVASLAAITDQTTGQQGALERNYQTLRRSLRRDTRSAAAGQAKLATALTNYTDARGKLADTDAELRNRTALGNAEALTRVSIANAQSDMNRNSDIARLTLDQEKFNADVHNNTLNQLRLGLANRDTGIAGAWANGINSAFVGVGNGVNKSGDTWSNTINELNANQMNLDYLIYGQDPSVQINVASSTNNRSLAEWLYNRYKNSNPNMVAGLKSQFNFA